MKQLLLDIVVYFLEYFEFLTIYSIKFKVENWM